MTFFLEINITGHAVNWRGSDPFFVFEINFVAILSYACSSDLQFLLKWAARICGPSKWATARKRSRNTDLGKVQ